MMTFFKLLVVFFVGILLIVLYPSIVSLIGYWKTMADFVYTMPTIDRIFFEALPLIALGLIVWFLYKLFTGRIRRL